MGSGYTNWTKWRIEWVAKESNVWREFVRRREAYRPEWEAGREPGFGTGDLWKQVWSGMLKDDESLRMRARDLVDLVPPKQRGVGIKKGELPKPVIEEEWEMPERMDEEAFGGRTCNAVEAARWASANLAVKKPRIETCPGPEAWHLLWWARQSEENQKSFKTQIFAKAISPKSDAAGNESGVDDVDREVASLLSELEVGG